MQEPADAATQRSPDPGLTAHPETFDPGACESEPIHLPGAIQPHGALLAALVADGRITHASANITDYLGAPPATLLGLPLRQVIGEAAWGALADPRAEAGVVQFFTDTHGFPLGLPHRALHLRAHRTGNHLCVDIEPTAPAALAGVLTRLIQPALERLKSATGVRELCELVVQELRSLTGYDRVLVYRFGAQGDGEVFAEARDPAVDPYLGLRFPAADIPAQARRLYLRQGMGLVADAAYRPVPLVTLDTVPLDLTCSSLRSISPLHREYMGNMGTAASLTLSLTLKPGHLSGHGPEDQPPEMPEKMREGVPEDMSEEMQRGPLWGLLVCHDRRPRLPDLETRLAADLIGRIVSVLLANQESLAADAERLRRRPALQAVLRGLSAAQPLPEALEAVTGAFLAATRATGAVLSLSGGLLPLGHAPPLAVAGRVLARLQDQAAGPLLAVESLGALDDEFAGYAETACGALLMRLGPAGGDAVVWFRPELVRTIAWGGNPAEHATTDPHSGRTSPRRSFAIWRESVRGRSLAWNAADRALAQDIGQALQAELAQRVRQQLALAMQAASRAKSRFLAGMSHELRTPLNGILGHAQLLALDRGLNPAQARRVEAMLSAGTHLLRIIGGVLELSEIEADHASVEPSAFDPGTIARECLDLLRPIAEKKHLWLRLDVAATVPAIFVSDPTRFRQILLNLLGNAVKFTREGGVEVRLRMAADGSPLRLEVADTGPGIDIAKRHQLFQAFQRLGSPDDGAGSAGLGLAITARLAALLGGDVGHDDNPGGGSIFWLELPRGVAAAVRPAAAPPDAGAPGDHPGDAPGDISGDAPGQGAPPVAQGALRVLVADDSAINRDVAQGFLQAAGHLVTVAEDGAEAAAVAAETDFDLILMDVRMPRMGGIEATRRIRALAGPRGRVAILALTAQAFAEQLEECRQAGMDGHLTKPFTMEGLLAAIASGLAARRRPPAPPPRPDPQTHPPPP